MSPRRTSSCHFFLDSNSSPSLLDPLSHPYSLPVISSISSLSVISRCLTDHPKIQKIKPEIIHYFSQVSGQFCGFEGLGQAGSADLGEVLSCISWCVGWGTDESRGTSLTYPVVGWLMHG